jgi:hypothetical protein
MKLLKTALDKQDYNLAAHVLVYGLIKATQETTRDSANLSNLRNCHATKNKKRRRQG